MELRGLYGSEGGLKIGARGDSECHDEGLVYNSIDDKQTPWCRLTLTLVLLAVDWFLKNIYPAKPRLGNTNPMLQRQDGEVGNDGPDPTDDRFYSSPKG